MYSLLKNCKQGCHYEASLIKASRGNLVRLPQSFLSFAMTLSLFLFALNANALEIIYDAQIDAYFKQMAKPLVQNSGLRGVNFYLANSNQINAFATNEKEIVFYSGLINKTTNQNQLKGVMAHEMGHLIAQHHVKSRVKNSSSGVPAIAGTVLGLGAVIAGAPQAGYAAIIGGSAAGASKQLSHSREHENEADSIAIKLLHSTESSTQGLAEFFKILDREEQSFAKENPEFLSTHPSTENRKSFVQNNMIIEEKIEPTSEYQMVKAKVYALTENPEKVKNKYSLEDDTSAKFLALAIAYMNSGEFKEAFENLENSKMLGLPKQWYYDMLGQIMYQRADFEESVIYYKKSQSFGNVSWIVDFQIAESYFGMKSPKALDYYFKALAKFKEFQYTYKRIGDFYAQDDKMTMAHYYLTQYYQKIGDKKLTATHLKLAQEFYKQEKLDNDFLIQQLTELEEQIEKDKKK